MKARQTGDAWVKPERRRPFGACDAANGEVARRAGRVARSAVLLGLKVTRALLDEGIRRMERPATADAHPAQHHIEKIDIR